MKTDFKIGDKVIFVREPTEEEWVGIGKIDHTYSIGDVLEISNIYESNGSIQFKGDIFNYPMVAFQFAYPKANDYIVTLKGNFKDTHCGKENYCFKLRANSTCINPWVDLRGCSNNGYYAMAFDLTKDLKEWRYATSGEIKRYDELGKPFDVTEFVMKTPKAGDYVVTLEVDGDGFNCGKSNYCFKIRETKIGLYPCVDLSGSKYNGHNAMSWDLKGHLKKWRWATSEEILKYDELGKPFSIIWKMPIKGDYIVTLEGKFSETSCAKENYCFKLRTSEEYIEPCIDLKGSETNGNSYLNFYLTLSLKKWRFAAPEEIREYDKRGKPFDVTELLYKKEEDSSKEFKRTPEFKIGDTVIVCTSGCGIGFEDIGKRVVITEIGTYCDEVGYKMTPKIGNTLGSSYGGFVGESSFKLVKDAPISDFEGIVYKNPYDFVKFSKPSVDPYCFTGHKSIPPIKVILIDVPKI